MKSWAMHALAYQQPEHIIGGTKVLSNTTYPWMVSLQGDLAVHGYDHFCGATLIAPNILVSAAHCDIRTYEKAVFNVLQYNDTDALVVGIDRIVNHPDYHDPTSNNDIALVFLKDSVPNQVAKLNWDITLENPGTMTTIIGWGRLVDDPQAPASLDLMHVDVPLVSNQNCNDAYNNVITDGMICAGITEGGKDSCQGDSGGPLVVNNTLVGVVSWGAGCALAGFPGVYARVSHYYDWILSEAPELSQSPTHSPLTNDQTYILIYYLSSNQMLLYVILGLFVVDLTCVCVHGYLNTYVRVGISFYGGYGYGATSDIDYGGHRVVVGEHGRDNSTGYIHVYDWDVITSKYWKTAIIPGEQERDRIGRRLVLSENGKRFATITDAGSNSVLRIYEQRTASPTPTSPPVTLVDELNTDPLPDHMNYTNWTKITDESIITGGDHLALNDDGGILIAGVKTYDNIGGTTWVDRGVDLPYPISSSRSYGKDTETFVLSEYDGDLDAAQVRVYQYNNVNNQYVQVGQTLSGPNQTGWGTHTAISDDGYTIVVSAPTGKVDNVEDASGYLEVLEWTGIEWVRKGELINGTVDGDGIGSDTLSITAGGNSIIANDGGELKIFSWIDTPTPTANPTTSPMGPASVGHGDRRILKTDRDPDPYREWFQYSPNVTIGGLGGQISGSGFAVVTTNVNLQLMRIFANIFAPETITDAPSMSPSAAPSVSPSANPTTLSPTGNPTLRPTGVPTKKPVEEPDRTGAYVGGTLGALAFVGLITLWRFRKSINYKRLKLIY